MICELILHNYIDISITEKEIMDKSKGDALSKGLVILQTTWFAIQCIMRHVQHLPITELEFVTLAFVTLNLITYVCWWHKPFNMQSAVPVVLKRMIDDQDWKSVTPDVWSQRPPAAAVNDKRLDHGTTVEGQVGEKQTADEGRGVVGMVLRPIHCWIGLIGSFAVGTQDDEVDLSLAERVPTLYSGPLITWVEFNYCNLVFATVGMFFGGIHCMAWSYSFPSYVEQILWRVSCMVIVGVPGFYFVMYAVVTLSTAAYNVPSFLQPIWKIMMPPLLIMYFICRIVLFVLAFMSFRSLPPGAYEAIRWTKFIPHV